MNIYQMRVFLMVGLLLFVASCKKDDDGDQYDDDYLEEDPIESPEIDDYGNVESEVNTETGVVITKPDEDDLARIKNYLLRGKYKRVIQITGENPQDNVMKYYLGVAYYCLMKLSDRYPESKRFQYRRQATALLQQVGFESRDDNLSARALLWYGMAVHLNNEDLAKKRVAVGAFHRIQSTRLKETPVYDDSILYSAQVYKQMGWYIQARKFYKKLATIGSVDNRVWDPEAKTYLSPEEASERGLEEVRRICLGS